MSFQNGGFDVYRGRLQSLQRTPCRLDALLDPDQRQCLFIDTRVDRRILPGGQRFRQPTRVLVPLSRDGARGMLGPLLDFDQQIASPIDGVGMLAYPGLGFPMERNGLAQPIPAIVLAAASMLRRPD